VRLGSGNLGLPSPACQKRINSCPKRHYIVIIIIYEENHPAYSLIIPVAA
jgi:hypothetical protein